MTALPPDVADCLRDIVGFELGDAEPVHGGYARNQRWRVAVGDAFVFVKPAPTRALADALRVERRAYQDVGAPFMPRLVGWSDSGERPFWCSRTCHAPAGRHRGRAAKPTGC